MSDFKGRHFRGEIVLWAVRWYCRYGISYRGSRADDGRTRRVGRSLDHLPVGAAVRTRDREAAALALAPAALASWRVDETYVKVRGKWSYLYRAVDKRLCCKVVGALRWKPRAKGGRAVSDFKGRHFRGEIVLWAVRWYCRYGISYRDLEEMMAERGVSVDHSTIYRWVQRYAPEIEKRLRWHWRRPRSRAGGSTRPT